MHHGAVHHRSSRSGPRRPEPQRPNPFDGHEHRRPDVEAAEAARLLRDHFGVDGVLRELGSHQDRNYRVTTPAGDRYVLKIARRGLSRAGLEAENEAMIRAAAAGLPFEVPVPQPATDSSLIVAAVTAAGAAHDLRLVTWIDGEPLDRARYLAPGVLRAHGAMAATIALALDGWDHPSLDRVLQWDVRHAGDVVGALLPFAATPAHRRLLTQAIEDATAALDALAPELRVRVVHQDVTDLNTVTRRDAAGRPMPVGLIDFGDLSRTWLAAELAVTIAADVAHDPARPIQLGREVARGFLPLLPLEEAELAAVWPMVVARAAAVAISGDQQGTLEPDNAYVHATRAEEWTALEAVAAIPFPLATEVLRETAGLASIDRSQVEVAHAPLLPGIDRLPVLDLSTTSDDLDGAATGDRQALAAAVARAGGRAIGRWGEARLADTELDTAEEPATVHLGVDVFVEAGARIRAPIDGRARHIAGGLALEGGAVTLRLDGIRPSVGDGTEVAAGEQLGQVDRPRADGRPAGVHVQRIDQPGLIAPRRAQSSIAAAWRRLCPDPSHLLGLAPVAAPPDDPGGLRARRDAVLAPVQEHYFAAPPRIERGWRHHLVDTGGRSYVDVVNNVAVLGHSHPAVEAAVRGQLARLNTNSRFLYAVMVEYAEALVARFPAPLDTVFVVNTGSEANELALRLARTATGGTEVLAVRGAYHGWTAATDAISTSHLDNPNAIGTRPSWVRTVEAPNVYRGLHRGPDAGTRYADSVRTTLAGIAADGHRPAAFIAEPLFGNAGGVVLPDGYLAQVYRDVRAAGGLAIADEVQTGYGRLGAFEWAFQQQGVVPDIVTVAKAAGNGMAVGAVVTTRAVADAFAAEGSFFSTVGGSPVACAAGLAVLQAMDEEGLQGNAWRVGAHLKAGLEALADRHAIVGAVHGMGLYLGVELIRDAESLEPARDEASAICERMLELGVIVQPTGDGGNVLKVKPPLCLTRESADHVIAALERTLDDGW